MLKGICIHCMDSVPVIEANHNCRYNAEEYSEWFNPEYQCVPHDCDGDNSIPILVAEDE